MVLKSSRGFTIVELSIVLAVVALIAGTVLAMGASRLEASRLQTTKDRMEFLQNVIGLYVKQFCHLPCPADGSLAVDSTSFGTGTGTGTGSCTAGNLSTVTQTSPNFNVIVGGIVPTRTLQVSPAMAFDGWNRRITYVVALPYTLPGTSGYSQSYAPATQAAITVNGSSSSQITNDAAYVMVSHGANGFNAWRAKGGSRLGASADTEENENNNSNATFVQKFITTSFDDMVVFQPQWQLPLCN